MSSNMKWCSGLCLTLELISLWTDWPQINVLRLATVPIVAFIAIYGLTGPHMRRLGLSTHLLAVLSGAASMAVVSIWWKLTA